MVIKRSNTVCCHPCFTRKTRGEEERKQEVIVLFELLSLPLLEFMTTSCELQASHKHCLGDVSLHSLFLV